MTAIEITLPSVPETYSAPTVHSKPTFTEDKSVSIAGKYVYYFKKSLASTGSKGNAKHHYDHFELHEKSQGNKKSNEADLESDDEEEDPGLLNRSARDWKQQDHYAILGLSALRYKATPDQITKQYRKKALMHHPDKKIAMAGGVANPQFDEYYKCVQKAHNTLIDPVRRRQYDSVDPQIPEGYPVKVSKKNFFKTYSKIFELEGRFSRKQPVPKLGDINSTKEETEEFYDFFMNFDSWRSFEYLDKEDPGEADNRDNKRYIEKKNKNARDKAKKEDNQRLKDLLSECMKQDPRIIKFKEEEKLRRNAKKIQKEAEEKAALEAKLQAEEEAKKKEQEQLEAERQKKESVKKDKEAAKKLIRKEKKQIKNIVKDSNYFFPASESPSATQITEKLDILDKILAANKEPEQLVKLRSDLEAAVSSGTAEEVFASIASNL
ncbi:hypothetical protein BB560_000782 [Smittium megazygosporum]|uniref:J domain-containing protein n=1 Tax=Smittium megazygosporum TaxID=133381 RepID=A0A2T9ZJD8_9FUNG|nr:hypothetical protein BB560_005902 [Smittium megazygosporum]PVV04709.1 hypothetical protein BB560_000782 [Smittium megazygosporum]